MLNLDPSMFTRFGVTFQKGDIIFCEFEPGEAFYLIQSGRVHLLKIIGGIEKTIDILNPGEMFGEMAILEEAPRSATALALDTVKALVFNKQNFGVLMQGNPQIALTLLRVFTKRIFDAKRRFMILTLDDIEARVADVFLMLTESPGNESLTGDRIEFPTSIDDVAQWAGISPAQAGEVLNHFVSQRRVEIYPNKIVVKNINDFTRFVSSRRTED
jgi:CRP/FNR family cyclic AMP-dependent transcriptional regulator